MPTKISELLEAAGAAALPVMRDIDESTYSQPTPCAEYRVDALLNHLYQVVVNFQALAARRPADFQSTPDHLCPGWRDRFAAEVGKLVEAWSDPHALRGVSPGIGLPQPTVGRMALLDLTIHPWDLAVATGQSFRPDPDGVQTLHELLAELGDLPRRMKVVGEIHPVPGDAGAFERLLGLAGRDPHWVAHDGPCAATARDYDEPHLAAVFFSGVEGVRPCPRRNSRGSPRRRPAVCGPPQACATTSSPSCWGPP